MTRNRTALDMFFAIGTELMVVLCSYCDGVGGFSVLHARARSRAACRGKLRRRCSARGCMRGCPARPDRSSDTGGRSRDRLDRYSRRALREFKDYCVGRSENAASFPVRKFFYLFPCEYCSATTCRPACCWSRGSAAVRRRARLSHRVAGPRMGGNHLIGIYGRLRRASRVERLEIG